jgi:hypothetical protein
MRILLSPSILLALFEHAIDPVVCHAFLTAHV